MQRDALDYHSRGRRGKIEVVPTKPCVTQRDLSLAYSPGVAEPCRVIEQSPEAAYEYTAKGNLVGVITNGTAVLGLGNIGALAGKPVMEGKGVLFKRFADIDVFDIEVAETDPDQFIETVKRLAPTFGGINLEDIKAPECFYIEERLKAELDIPVFHDDQHGTAIITSAALLNALEVTERRIEDAKVVFSGAGAAAISCAKLFLKLGVRRENLVMADKDGVVFKGRTHAMNPMLEQMAVETPHRTLAEAMVGADVFVGLSAARIVSPDMVRSMAPRAIVFALANPEPEISYEEAKAARPDILMGTGRSDFPNQINNVLGFPYIFRGALDVRARAINDEMKLAAVYALAALAKQDVPDQVLTAYSSKHLEYGPDYIIPKPF
ncbi:MAG TPA: malic enzyme-like NAD(P)-binding protein, partial [Stenomitos sp.]